MTEKKTKRNVIIGIDDSEFSEFAFDCELWKLLSKYRELN